MARIGGVIFDALIRIWLEMFGRSVVVDESPWIDGAVGVGREIGVKVYDDVADQMGLERSTAQPAGLMSSFDLLAGPDFDPAQVRPEVRDFYERTSCYEIDAWATWSRSFKPLAKILVGLISRRVDQLNLPVDPLDTAGGINSQVIPLVDPDTGALRASGWLRRVRSTGKVIYAGIYELVELPGGRGRVVKTVFPLPRGNVAAILRPQAMPDGSFRLVSKGKRFGDAGMYRTLGTGRVRKVRYIRAMHESIHVFVDEDGALRTDHRFFFWGHTMLHIHYRIRPKVMAVAA